MEKELMKVDTLSISKGLNRNQRQCPRCDDILTPSHNYDMKICKCGYLSIDGGMNLRIMLTDTSNNNGGKLI
ncbi:DUF7695 domain-containing protein [Parapedobacter koreensis]|uniref:DUF7695 domain-containing protein n=1 Tax=Parapedobacter koreensis TaxID=332977 RepID=A0A1H7P581_9SPHI|nr:hypothetical protein [Parapedobacter koreensis]SEL30922.1 hypothetical protein SAMN05421740_104218 [Parapedobacter koreensis]